MPVICGHGNLRASRHLVWAASHEPLLHLADLLLKSVQALNRGERRFVDDLKTYLIRVRHYCKTKSFICCAT